MYLHFFSANGTLLSLAQQSLFPLTFEEIGQENGFLMYETSIKQLFSDPAKLEILNVHDRAYIYVNKEPRGILSRGEKVTSMPLTVDPGDTVSKFKIKNLFLKMAEKIFIYKNKHLPMQ